MTVVSTIAGAEDLVGKGVYVGMPETLPQPIRDRHAVVVGGTAECAAAARRLAAAGWTVTAVVREKDCACGTTRGCRRTVGTELVCASGINYLEALVLRRIASGRIDACNASALFVL